jgi:hypothetical protein
LTTDSTTERESSRLSLTLKARLGKKEPIPSLSFPMSGNINPTVRVGDEEIFEMFENILSSPTTNLLLDLII